MKKVALALCLVLAAASSAGAVDVINGCYMKVNGQFRILLPGDTCNASEVLLSFRSATDSSGLAPEVYDANGQFLGVGMLDELYIPSMRKWTKINLRDMSGDVWPGQLYYQSEDCSGQPYAEYEYLHQVFSIGQPEEKKYYTAAAETAGYLDFLSYADGSGNCQLFDFGAYHTVMPKAVPVTLPFTLPVALPTKIVGPKTGLAGRIGR